MYLSLRWRFPDIRAGQNNVGGSVQTGISMIPSGPRWVFSIFSSEVSQLLFLTSIICAGTGLFLSQLWLLRFRSQSVTVISIAANDTTYCWILSLRRIYLGTLRLSELPFATEGPPAPNNCKCTYRIHKASLSSCSSLECLRQLLPSPQQPEQPQQLQDSPGLVSAPFLAAGNNCPPSLQKGLQIVNPLRLNS